MGKFLFITLALLLVLCLTPAYGADDEFYSMDGFDQPAAAPKGPVPWYISGVSYQGFKVVTVAEAEEVVESKPAPALALRQGEPYSSFKVEETCGACGCCFRKKAISTPR